MKHDGLGPLVAGAQEELGFTPTADRLLGPLALSAAGGLQELMDLRSQEFGLTGGGGPGGTVAQQILLWDDRTTAPARKSSLLFQPSELRDDLLPRRRCAGRRGGTPSTHWPSFINRRYGRTLRTATLGLDWRACEPLGSHVSSDDVDAS